MTTNQHNQSYADYSAHPLINPVCKKNSNTVLPFLQEQCIMLMSAKPHNNLPSWQSDNFCRDARKMHVTTFLIHA